MAVPLVLDSRETILSVFDTFREELDEHNDRRERLKVRRLGTQGTIWLPSGLCFGSL